MGLTFSLIFTFSSAVKVFINKMYHISDVYCHNDVIKLNGLYAARCMYQAIARNTPPAHMLVIIGSQVGKFCRSFWQGSDCVI